MSWNHPRSEISGKAKLRLLSEVGRKARFMTTPEIQERVPTLQRREISFLRCERPDYFGWEKLLVIAEQLGVDVEIRVGSAA